MPVRRAPGREAAAAADATPLPFERLHSLAVLGLLREACLPLNFSYTTCRACEQVCPVAALRVQADTLALSDACLGCGRCVAACPTGALALGGCTVPASVAQDADAIPVECWKVPREESPAHAVRVPCLGALAVSQWLALARAAEGRPVIAIDRGWCARCSAGGAGPHPAAGPLAEANALLVEAGLSERDLPRFEHRPLPIAKMPRTIPPADDDPSLSRRDFFGRLAREATATVRQVQATPLNTGRRPALRPGALRAPEREHRIGLLTRLAESAGGRLPARLFVTLAASDRCRNHRVCVALCPTAALRAYDSAEAAGIVFDPLACIACGACERGCPEKALRLLPHTTATTAAEPTRLTQHRLRECAGCGRPFAGDGELCAPCHKSQALVRSVFASLSPGGNRDWDRQAGAWKSSAEPPTENEERQA